MEVPENRKWMYKRTYPGPGLRPLNPEFVKGADKFVEYVCQSSKYFIEGRLRCPCVDCRSRYWQDPDTVKYHLYKRGFKPDYWYWTDHGELAPDNSMGPEVSIGENHVLGEGNVVDRCPNIADGDATTNVPIVPKAHSQANTNGEASKPQNKTFLEPDDDLGFLPSKPAATAIAKVIQSGYNHPWPSWKKIPLTTREVWFKEFQGYVWWKPEHNLHMWRAYNSRSSKRLSDLLGKARELNLRPLWIREGVWEELWKQWGTSEYKQKCQQAKRNRASDPQKCLHTGGCISKATHAQKLAKVKDIQSQPRADEILSDAHLKKANHNPVTANIKQAYGEFQAKKARVDDDDDELGSQASNNRLEESSSSKSASSHVPEHVINQVKEQLQHKMKDQIQKEIQQMREDIDSKWKRRFEKYQLKQEKRFGKLLKSYSGSTNKNEEDGDDEEEE